MLRKRPKPPAPQQAGSDAATEETFAAQPAQSGSMIDNPSFRAPQFGIKPRASTQAVRVQHAPKRRYESERA